MILPLWLGDNPTFPDPRTAHHHGLLALGGDLGSERLLAAYRMGIFPWFGPDDPIMWWSPDPRAILFPREFHLARSLLRRLRKNDYVIRLDYAFAEVIQICAAIPRAGENGTWIVPEMIEAYSALHAEGHAHSVELWLRPDESPHSPAADMPLIYDEKGYTLAGGCYGVEVNSVFCAESMFSRVRDASKISLAALICLAIARRAEGHNEIRALDCQFLTAHLASLGAREISRQDYLGLLAQDMQAEQNTISGQDWRRQQALFDDESWPNELARMLH